MNEQDVKRRRSERPEKKKKDAALTAPKKLKLLFTVVDRKKAELYA